ncbi:MAG: DEAD/DEAH box helicase [Verrucomicrobiota bacterium]
MSFQEFGLEEKIVHGAQRLRYIDPTPIQAEAIPRILAGVDIIGSAQTGTGKTAAFVLPMLSKLKNTGKLRALIVEPTRELAAQVFEVCQDLSHFTDMHITLLHGGVKYENQKKSLSQNPDVVIATPGRLLDHLQQKQLNFNCLEMLVIDEADRMLDMGFIPDIRRIINYCPDKRQTLLFSATVAQAIESLASWAMVNPEKIIIGHRQSPAETVAHAFYPVARDQKFELLLELLEQSHYESVIVFCRTKAETDKISSWLDTHGHTVAVLHSDRSQSQRTKALQEFKAGKAEVLVATDIAARGLDISTVTHVINFDIPQNPEDYVHRIGRTGRAAATGDALTLITGEDLDQVRSIEHYIGKSVEKKKIANFCYTYTALLDKSPRAKSSSRSRRRKR